MKTVLITGGNRGLGLSLVTTFSKAGWQVFRTARNVESLPNQLENFVKFPLDLSNHESVVALADELLQRKTTIDVVIHNAGFNPKDQTNREGYFDSTFYVEKFSAANVGESMTINALHPMELTGRIHPVLAEDAAVIAISSWLGSIGAKAVPGHYGYTGSKALMNMMIKGMSLEFAKTSRVAVTMNPGWMKTDMGGANADISSDQVAERILRMIDDGFIRKCNARTTSKEEKQQELTKNIGSEIDDQRLRRELFVRVCDCVLERATSFQLDDAAVAVPIQWLRNEYSVVPSPPDENGSDEETTDVLLMSCVISPRDSTIQDAFDDYQHAIPDAVVQTVELALRKIADEHCYECELWGTSPAPLPLRPSSGYDGIVGTRRTVGEMTTVMRRWGIVVQDDMLAGEIISELRFLVDKAICDVEAKLKRNRPHLLVGEDVFCFCEIASRSKQRFDLRLLSDKIEDFVEQHILSSSNGNGTRTFRFWKGG